MVLKVINHSSSASPRKSHTSLSYSGDCDNSSLRFSRFLNRHLLEAIEQPAAPRTGISDYYYIDIKSKRPVHITTTDNLLPLILTFLFKGKRRSLMSGIDEMYSRYALKYNSNISHSLCIHILSKNIVFLDEHIIARYSSSRPLVARALRLKLTRIYRISSAFLDHCHYKYSLSHSPSPRSLSGLHWSRIISKVKRVISGRGSRKVSVNDNIFRSVLMIAVFSSPGLSSGSFPLLLLGFSLGLAATIVVGILDISAARHAR